MICTAARGRAAWLCVMIGLTGAPACAPARYPRAVIDRPLVLPAGLARAGIDVATAADGRALATTSVAAVGLAGDLEIEASHELDVQASAGARTSEQTVGLELGVAAFQRAGWYSGLEVGERYDLTRGGWQSMSLGLDAWKVMGRVLIGLRGGELTIPVTGDGAATAILPLSVGVQLTPILFAELDADAAVTACVCDPVPTTFELVASALPRLDVTLELSERLAFSDGRLEGLDPSAMIGVRYYAGR